MNAKNKIRWFTLIELLIVVAIILILISIIQPALRKAITQAHVAACMNNLRNVGFALNLYSDDYYAFNVWGWQWWQRTPGKPFQEVYWHHESELGWGNVLYVDNNIKFTQATEFNPNWQEGEDYTFVPSR